MAQIRFGDKKINLPRSRLARIGLGLLFILGGLLWFLPVVGIWMIPLGFLVLASDNHAIRRLNRRILVAVKGWWDRRASRDERKAARDASGGGKGE